MHVHNDLIKRSVRSHSWHQREFLKEQTNDPLKLHVCTCFMRGNLHKTPLETKIHSVFIALHSLALKTSGGMHHTWTPSKN